MLRGTLVFREATLNVPRKNQTHIKIVAKDKSMQCEIIFVCDCRLDRMGFI